MSLTRRLFLRNSAAAGVTAAAVAVPAVVEAGQQPSPEDRARFHWQALCAAVEELTPDEADCRLQVFASHRHGCTEPRLRVEAMRTSMEQVHPGMTRPVERIVASYRLTSMTWEDEGIYPTYRGGAS